MEIPWQQVLTQGKEIFDNAVAELEESYDDPDSMEFQMALGHLFFAVAIMQSAIDEGLPSQAMSFFAELMRQSEVDSILDFVGYVQAQAEQSARDN